MVKKILLLLILSYAFSIAGSKGYQISFNHSQNHEYELSFSLSDYQLSNGDFGGQTYSVIRFDAGVFTQKKGFAQLPYVSAAVELPADKNMDIFFSVEDYEDIPLNNPLLPSRGVIYRNQNPDEIPYEIDPASLTDSWYPGDAAEQSRPFIVKDMRGCSVHFYPFQYNGLNQTLRVYKSIKVQLRENDEAPTNPLLSEAPAPLHEMRGIYNSLFINHTDASSTLSMDQYGDILVITTARDEAAIDPYIQWKREKGFNVSKEVVATGTLVKDLIQQKYNENNNLLYVQLVGDWDDIKSELGTSSNLPMDPYMGCVAGDDDFQDIAIGRISAQSAAQVTVQVNKFLNYEKTPPGGSNWLSTATGIASDQGPGDDNEKDFEHDDVIWNDKLDPFTYDSYNAIYDPTASGSNVTTAVNNGTGLINYTGHGSSTSWGTTGFSNSDVNNLTNGDLLPWIVSVACNNGEFNRTGGDCFAEAWLKKENGGAVMFLGSTISQPWDPPMRGQDYFADVTVGGYNYDDHSGQSGINTSEQRTTIGSIIVNGHVLMLSESSTSSDLETTQTWTTFGDPSMQVRTKAPAALSLSNETVTSGQAFSTTVSANSQPVPGAMVTLSQDGSYYTAVSDENGQVNIDHGLTPGTALLVVTAFNTETIYDEVNVNSADGPWIEVDSYTIDDSQDGNGNNAADYGESFLLNIDAKNSGNATAYGVDGTLSSEDPYITITDKYYLFGEIGVGQTVQGSGVYALSAADNAPDQHSASCRIHFTDSESGSWNSDISITINAPDITCDDLTVDDSATGDDNGRLDAGETALFLIPSTNSGHASAPDASGQLTTDNTYLTINTATYELGTLAVDQTVTASFDVTASASTPAGEQAALYYTVACGAYTFKDTFYVNIGDLPAYTMSNSTEYVNQGMFYDSGNADGDYASREQTTMTFYPAEGKPAVHFSFLEFSLSDVDKLYIYNGPDKNAPEIAGSPFMATNSPGDIIAENPDGALTFFFQSNLAGTASGWKAEISTSSVSDAREGINEALPERFALLANYPNPFNPVTVIGYNVQTIHESSVHVDLAVYNLLGEKIRTLVNRRQEAGTYTVEFDGAYLPSGVYFYTISAGKFTAVRKMILMK